MADEWSGRRRAAALRRVKALGRANRTPCSICGQSIDYSLEYPHPQSCSVQHIKARASFPHLVWDPSNWAPSHLDCNKAAGVQAKVAPLGVTSQEW